MVATRTGCFQPQHGGGFGAQAPASEKKCDNSREYGTRFPSCSLIFSCQWRDCVVGREVQDCSPAQQLKILQSLVRPASKFLSSSLKRAGQLPEAPGVTSAASMKNGNRPADGKTTAPTPRPTQACHPGVLEAGRLTWVDQGLHSYVDTAAAAGYGAAGWAGSRIRRHLQPQPR